MNIDEKTNDLIDLLGFAPDSLSALAVKTALLFARNEALEEAAGVADTVLGEEDGYEWETACQTTAAHIRALKK